MLGCNVSLGVKMSQRIYAASEIAEAAIVVHVAAAFILKKHVVWQQRPEERTM